MKTLILRVRKPYFDKMPDEKSVEYRQDSRFWQLKLDKLFKSLSVDLEYVLANTNITFAFPINNDDEVQLLFLCGRRAKWIQVLEIARVKTPENFSAQGKKDVPTQTCFAFTLGKLLKQK